MENLSTIVGKRAASSLQKVIIITAVIAAILVVGIMVKDNMEKCTSAVDLYTAELDASMQQKLSFIETLANGVSSGAISSEEYYDYVDKMVAMYDDVSAVYVCVPEDGVIYKDGINTYMSGGWIPPEDFIVSERAWFKGAVEAGGLYISAPYVDEQSGDACITMAHIVNTENGKGVAGLDMYMSDLVTLAEGSYVDNNYMMIIAADGTILTNPDEKYALTAEKSVNVADTPYNKVYGKDYKNASISEKKGGNKIAISKKSELSGWTVIYCFSTLPMTFTLIAFVLVVIVAIILSVKFSSKRLVKSITPMFAPLEEVSNSVANITEGNLDYHFVEDMQSLEVNHVTSSLNTTIEGLKYYIDEINDVVSAVANKDLAFSVTGEFRGDYEKIKNSLEQIIAVLNESFAEINAGSDTVRGYADDLAHTSEAVADAATSQSHAIADANAEVNNLAESMSDISRIAEDVEKNAEDTNKRLTAGGQEMEELVKAMDNIINCFEGIANFVTEINNIASQTSLLSLNASIEAARAGEAGRGFAVVAQEIQDLSSNSTNASEKIEEVISQSREAVDHGKMLVERTQKTIEDGINYSVENTKNVTKIADAVENQRRSVDEISARFKEISDMVQNNAASAEENSAIATQLGECAKALSDTVNEFKLR